MTIAEAPLAAVFGLAGLSLTEAERAFFKRVRPAGYILFARNINNPEQVSAMVSDLRNLTPDFEAFVLIDQEGGRVQRLKPPHWRHAPASGEFEPLYATDPAKAEAMVRLNIQLIGEELKALGIDVDCAPVADVPVPGAHDVIGDRAFSKDPAVVARLGAAVCEGLWDAGVLPVIKHIPGHGRAMSDSHLELPVVTAGLAELRAADFVPFRQLSQLPGLMFAMTAHVVYTAIDPKNPATTSPKVISEIIRGEIGFDGILISDDLGMKALAGPYDARAEAARAAGCDLMLHCDGNLADMEAVARTAGPLGARGLKALADVQSRRPRAKIADAGVAQFKILDALRQIEAKHV
ncbi:MAG: beta-N-acetylhexosaminidase [Rhodospirillaceae bacterium]|nr:beta-N-acetylhexosaminidase [Rhodospirillaceae bacterium]